MSSVINTSNSGKFCVRKSHVWYKYLHVFWTETSYILFKNLFNFNNFFKSISCCFSVSHDRLFATPWTAALQASLSFTLSQRLLKLMSIESVMPLNHYKYVLFWMYLYISLSLSTLLSKHIDGLWIKEHILKYYSVYISENSKKMKTPNKKNIYIFTIIFLNLFSDQKSRIYAWGRG